MAKRESVVGSEGDEATIRGGEPSWMLLIGKRVEVWCATYIYEGVLEDVSMTHFHLIDCGIVFETGEFSQDRYKDRQKLKKTRYVAIQAHESICESGQKP